MTYDRQFFLDFIDTLPEEQKKCSVKTNEDGTGTVELADFIVHYGEALVKHIQENGNKPKSNRKPRTKKVPS